MKRLFALLIVIIMLSMVVLPVSAATADEIMPCYTHVSSVHADLSIDETLGVVTCSGYVTSQKVAPVKVIVRLQMYKNGTWTNLKSWTSTGTTYAYASGQYAVAKGYTYRTYVIGYVYDSDGNVVESATVYYSKYFSK